MLLWQLGYHPNPFALSPESYEKVWNDFLSPVPVPIAFLGVSFQGARMKSGCEILQASVQADNWLALEDAQFPFTCVESQNEVSEHEIREWGEVFSAQKWVELRRLQHAVARREGPNSHAISKVKFLGCVMEAVRNSLGLWPDEPSSVMESEDIGIVETDRSPLANGVHTGDIDWNPSIAHDRFPVFCTQQLNAALQEVFSESRRKDPHGLKIWQQKSLQMRLLWDIQSSLIGLRGEGPGSPILMMLCMLGYPSLRFSNVHVSPQDSPHARPDIPYVQGQNSGNVILSVNEIDDISSAGSDDAKLEESVAFTTKCTEEKFICLRINVAEAPQPLHIIFQWDSASKKATVQIGCDSINEPGLFCWRSWKDGFLGRICAQSEWRSTHSRNTNELILRRMTVSTVNEDNEVSRFPTPIEHWPTWFSLAPVMTRDCGTNSSKSIDVEAEIDAAVDTSELKCECGCEAHKMFLKAKELEESGHENEALDIFERCIIDYGHYFALERYARISLSSYR